MVVKTVLLVVLMGANGTAVTRTLWCGAPHSVSALMRRSRADLQCVKQSPGRASSGGWAKLKTRTRRTRTRWES